MTAPAPADIDVLERSDSRKGIGPFSTPLSALRGGLDRIEARLRELAVPVGSLETETAHSRGVVAEQSARLGRLNSRIERIENRLEILPA